MSPANRTYQSVYDLSEIMSNVEMTSNHVNKMSFFKFSNNQNHHRQHNQQQKQQQHQPYHNQYTNTMNHWNIYSFNNIDNNRHQRKSKHVTTENEWIQQFQRLNESRPKMRRRHEKRWNQHNHNQFIGFTNDQVKSNLHADLEIQSARMHESSNNTENIQMHWPVKKEAIMEGDLILGGLMMVHSREDLMMCGPIMPQGGIQALEAMLFTLDRINDDLHLLPNIKIGAHILDDCDRDSYGLEMAVDFIKGM